MDNKQIIHIATEVITIVGLSIYFSRQNKKLFDSIEILTKSLNEQNEIIQKHENMINKLVETIQELIARPQMQPQMQPQMPPQMPPQIQPQPQPQMQPQISPQMQAQMPPQMQREMKPKKTVRIVSEAQEIPPNFQARHVQFQFMQRPSSPEFVNEGKVEEIIDSESENEEDEKIIEEELLDDELADELKELEE